MDVYAEDSSLLECVIVVKPNILVLLHITQIFLQFNSLLAGSVMARSLLYEHVEKSCVDKRKLTAKSTLELSSP